MEVKENILVIFPDWEDRSVLGFKRNLGNASFKSVICLVFDDSLNPQETDRNLEKIQEISDTHGIHLTKVNLSKGHSIYNWDSLIDFFGKLNGKTQKIFIDISTMPREVIWIILFGLRDIFPELDIIYHKPEKYHQTWLSREPDSPRLLFKHSGIFDLEKSTLLIIIPGFDDERVKQLILFFDPRKTILALQKGEQFNNSARNNKNLYAEYCVDIIELNAYSDDWGYGTLDAAIKEHTSIYNIVIASLGPKLTAISLYKLNLTYPEIALAYVPCKEFNSKYSEGIGDSINRTIELT